MRVLIFGDVHGNLLALEKMLQEEKGRTDLLLCHGDVVNYGPWSNECVQLLSDLNCTCLRGNHETYFLQESYPGQNIIAREFFNYCAPLFTERSTIAGYGESLAVGEFSVQHTVREQYIYPDTDIDSLNLEQDYIIGHSHRQFSAKSSRGKRLINTGSVGQNRHYINVINYVVYDTISGELGLKELVYDVDRVIKEMKSRGYPAICTDYYLKKERL